jgi:hypothetical protein
MLSVGASSVERKVIMGCVKLARKSDRLGFDALICSSYNRVDPQCRTQWFV